MTTYCIGDIQGCFVELQDLLNTIHYNEHSDELWFVGDLVNRGPNSLETLRFIKELPNKKVVLGNHDLHLLSFYHNIVDFEFEHIEQILYADDGSELVEWLRMQPLLYYDKKFDAVLVHAGIYPKWDLNDAIRHAGEVEAVLRGDNCVDLLKHLYGNEPASWSDNLKEWDRLRFIVNVFTRMRFCDSQGNLEFNHSGGISMAPFGFMPWFKIPWRKAKDLKIVFGHWSSLRGNSGEKNTFSLDTGCLWGGRLTAMCLDSGEIFSVPSRKL